MILIVVIGFIAIAYVCLITAFTLGFKSALHQQDENFEAKIKLSIVVAFRNEETNLSPLLNSMSNQTLSQDLYELILVDDHSTDNSLSTIQSVISKFQSLKILTLPVDFNGKKTALAYGIGQASNPIIVFTDADCIPSKFWLETISISAGKGADFMIGAVIMDPINGFTRRLQSLEYSSLMASAMGSFGIGHPVIASSANLAFRRDLLNIDAESMNTSVASGDDMFLLHTAKRLKGCRLEFLGDERVIVQTSTESTLAMALKQRKRWASKSIHYKDFDTIVTGFIVLIFNFLLAGLLIVSIFDIKYLFYFFILLAIKSFADYPLINRYLKFTGQHALLKVFIPLQLMYPIYVVYSFFTGILIKTSWKGRSIK